MFADDTSLFVIVEQPHTTADLLQDDIRKISTWAEKWLVTFNPSKSESLIVSRKRLRQPHPPLTMLGEQIPEVQEHKHLGVFLSNDCSWHSHIDYVTEKAWKRVNIMRKLKFSLDRKALEIIYISFIRPLLEYADVVWNNCTKYEMDRLDKIQHECARIASGASKLVSLEMLQEEINWESLTNRRYKHRLTLFYKMYTNETPNYLSSVIPQPTENRYNLRNSDNVNSIPARTAMNVNSFLPTVIRDWNNLPTDVRNSQSLLSFKRYLDKDKKYTPKYYYVGARKLQILHTRLRTKSSSLNQHLFLKNLSLSALCHCGEVETTYHYLLECNLHSVCRNSLFTKLRNYHIDVDTLLYGNPSLSDQDNSFIFQNVHTFISESKRFL